jgi:hypothetical protein
MIEIRPLRTYRLLRDDGTHLDFQTSNYVPLAKHLVEVKTNYADSINFFELLLTEPHAVDIIEIRNEDANL